MVEAQAAWLTRAHAGYVDCWLRRKWPYVRWRPTQFGEMVLWYATAGRRGGSDAMADTIVRKARSGQLPPRRRPTWRDALGLAHEVCRATNPVGWLTGGFERRDRVWSRLDEIHGVGPKIASFLMRDASFLRDHASGCVAGRMSYRDGRETGWFDRLKATDQALFVPIDAWVHAGARRHRASRLVGEHDVQAIQADPELHREAAAEIVVWARRRDLDPRDLDVYWYSLGAQNIQRDGTPAE